MSRPHIENAAAIGPLGISLETIWAAVMAGKTIYSKVSLPGHRKYFVAETKPGTGPDITAYASLFEDAIRSLVSELAPAEPVDAILLGTAVGNLGRVEGKTRPRSESRLNTLSTAPR